MTAKKNELLALCKKGIIPRSFHRWYQDLPSSSAKTELQPLLYPTKKNLESFAVKPILYFNIYQFQKLPILYFNPILIHFKTFK